MQKRRRYVSLFKHAYQRVHHRHAPCFMPSPYQTQRTKTLSLNKRLSAVPSYGEGVAHASLPATASNAFRLLTNGIRRLNGTT